MPFKECVWTADGLLRVSDEEARPELRQLDATWFVILRSFCYRVPQKERDAGTVYFIPGADAEANKETQERKTDETPSRKVIVPPNPCPGRTDLASVPPFFWWLIASYGNHTRAALLHDALYVDRGTPPPVPRSTADRLLLAALRERGPEKPGVFRHWLMWVAVSLFGNLGLVRGTLFALHVVAVWVLTIWALVESWGHALWQRSWPERVLIMVAVLIGVVILLAVLGTFWRAGVDLTGGWLSPFLLLALLLLIPLGVLWTWPLELEISPFNLLLVAFVLFLLGPLWALAIEDPEYRNWLWPTAVIGLPIALVPVALIFPAIGLVWLIDFGAALAASRRKDKTGKSRGFKMPELRATRLPL